MFKEVMISQALAARLDGRKGYAIHQNGNVVPLEEVFPSLEGTRFIIDVEEAKAPKVEVPESGMKAETPEKRKTGRPTEADQAKMEEKILKAWNRGERNISEICRITGINYRTVRKYIPETVNG